MRLAAGSARTRWGSLSAPPDPLAAIGGGVPTSKGERREGIGKGKERDGKREREDGKEGEGRKGMEGKVREGSPCMRSHK